MLVSPAVWPVHDGGPYAGALTSTFRTLMCECVSVSVQNSWSLASPMLNVLFYVFP